MKLSQWSFLAPERDLCLKRSHGDRTIDFNVFKGIFIISEKKRFGGKVNYMA
jgi:hypothetical protein